jgi:hypothetical protein
MQLSDMIQHDNDKGEAPAPQGYMKSSMRSRPPSATQGPGERRAGDGDKQTRKWVT